MNSTALELKNDEWFFIVKCLRELIDIGTNDDTFKRADKLADDIEELVQALN